MEEFLDEQRRRLKSKTFRNYESVIDLFQASMNGYGHQYLDASEQALFDSLYDAAGPAHREFCQVFGPEKIPENVGEFLNYFMPHKVICGKELLRAAGTVTKKLGKWLRDRGYLAAEEADAVTDRGATAVEELPAAEDCARILSDYADRTAPDCDEVVEDYFSLEAIGPSSLGLSSLIGDETITVPVSNHVANACRVGWTLAGSVGRTARGWRLVEVWNVYP